MTKNILILFIILVVSFETFAECRLVSTDSTSSAAVINEVKDWYACYCDDKLDIFGAKYSDKSRCDDKCTCQSDSQTSEGSLRDPEDTGDGTANTGS